VSRRRRAVDCADKQIEMVEAAARAGEQDGAHRRGRSLKKIGKEHVETISDKVRRQQVETARIGASARLFRTRRQRPRSREH
jgi:hypothetical protein